MDTSFRAKILMEDDKLIFEINESLDLYNAQKFARESVKNWLETHGEDMSPENIQIKINNETISYQ